MGISYSPAGSGVVVTPNSETIINSRTQFPRGGGGNVDLGTKTKYVMGDDVTLLAEDLPIDFGVGTAIEGGGFSGPQLSTAESGIIFRSISNSGALEADQCNFSFPNAQLLSAVDAIAVVLRTSFITASAVGSLSGTAFNMRDSTIQGLTSDGLTVAGANLLFFMVQSRLIATSGVDLIDITGATFTDFSIIGKSTLSAPAGGVGVRGDANSANITAGNLGIVEISSFTGGMTNFVNIARSNDRWDFRSLSSELDSEWSFQQELTADTVITITVLGQWEEAGGVNWVGTSSRIDIGADGSVTNNSGRVVCFSVGGHMSVDKVGGGSSEIELGVKKITTVLTGSGGRTENSAVTTVPFGHLVVLNNGERAIPVVRNNGGTSDVTIRAQSGWRGTT